MNSPLVLIIDDHPDSAAVFAEALRSVGFETEIIHSGDAALTRLTTVTPDLVVLDLSLPRVAGGDILHHIRTDSRLAKTPVIVATAHPEMTESAREADAVLIKPVSFNQLRKLATQLGLAASPDN
jgi:CheY-like chemotaxis protein